ncbi:MAG: hypothetical protein L0332_06220 [Chloroflexi bacterium]|nr:hypothetical protein [Chloroflexota bacterium]MCI0648801.1 hypothetical protein [Chloroflexota bacterium]MCI0726303.1 hypothetical protein [Chloroflexota bacterium]
MNKRILALMATALVVLGLSTFATVLAGQATPAAEENPPARPLYNYTAERLLRDPRPESPPQPTNPQIIPWSKLVFQSYRDNQWEIYNGNDDGSGQARLTQIVAADIHPRFNRGATRIVFSSKRSGTYEIFTMNADSSNQVRLTFTGFDNVNPAWSPDGARIAFQSYRDGQPEIYVMNADGSGQTRLTFDGDYDASPVWSPDGSKIAFVSRRTGGYRIYTMNANGSNQIQLSNQAYSNNPAWSPDGSKIAYDSDGDNDGWQEVWLMNASGSNQQQVYDSYQYQTDAWVRSWSPDGQYIAFTHISFIQQGGTWYWTQAYLNALNTTYWNAIGLSANDRDWNPDWQTVEIQAPTSSVNPLPIQSAGPIPVRWTGSDSGGSGLRSYDVQVRQGSDPWTDWLVNTTATSGSHPGVGGQTYSFRSRARDNAYNLEPWPAGPDAVTTVENLPPVSAIAPVSPFFRFGGNLLLYWSGWDPGGSGIARYDAQYRIGNGSWTNWQTGTTANSAVFSGAASGQTVAFRERAIDGAQNVEAWPAGNGDTQTTFYTWGASGLVQDNGNAPVVGATVTTNPAAVGTISGDSNGAYGGYVATTSSTYSLDLSKAGYGDLPAVIAPAGYDLRFNAILPPADNVVGNWGFESGSLEPEWNTDGAFTPVITNAIRHTGQYSTFFGQPPFTFGPLQNLSNIPVYSAYRPALVVDSQNKLHVLWGETGIHYARRNNNGTWLSVQLLDSMGGGEPNVVIGSNGVIHAVWSSYTGSEFVRYARLQNGNWSNPETVSSGSSYAREAYVAVGNNGIVHVIWKETYLSDRHLFYSQRNPNGGWTQPELVSGNGNDPFPGDFRVDNSGSVHLVYWQSPLSGDSEIFYTHRPIGGSWSLPLNLSNNSTNDYDPSLAVGPVGEVHVLWTNYDPPDGGLHYRQRNSSGDWLVAQKVAGLGGSSELAVAADGTLHIVWSSGEQIVYNQRLNNGAWADTTNLSGNTGFFSYPVLALDQSGFPHVAWGGSIYAAFYEDVSYTYMLSDGSWSAVQNLSNNSDNSYLPRIAIDYSGSVHIAWLDDSTGDGDLYYRGPAVTSVSGDSILTQVVTIPLTITSPSLSFLYQLGGTLSNNGSQLVAEVDDGNTTTSLLSLTGSTGTGWAHGRADLSSWSGQSVTLTFRLEQAANAPLAWAYLDEVSLGSTYPDLWVQGANAAALPGEQVTFLLTYGNRGGAAAGGTLITGTLPAGLTFVSASPPPVATSPNLVWNVGNLPAGSGPLTIAVTVMVNASVPPFTNLTIPFTIGQAGPELETANNSVAVIVFASRRIYLPLIFRN